MSTIISINTDKATSTAAKGSKAKNESKLTKEQTKRLAEFERIIRKSQHGFVAIAKAVVRIRDERLWVGSAKTMGAYFFERFDMSPQEVTRYTYDGQVLVLLEENGFASNLPINEGQARALADLKTDERRLAVWDGVIKSGKKITAQLIKDLAAPPVAPVVSAPATTPVARKTESSAAPSVESTAPSVATCHATLTVEIDSSVLKDALEYKGVACVEVLPNVYQFKISAKDKSGLFVELASWSNVYAVQKVTVVFE